MGALAWGSPWGSRPRGGDWAVPGWLHALVGTGLGLPGAHAAACQGMGENTVHAMPRSRAHVLTRPTAFILRAPGNSPVPAYGSPSPRKHLVPGRNMCEPQEEVGPHKCWLLDIRPPPVFRARDSPAQGVSSCRSVRRASRGRPSEAFAASADSGSRRLRFQRGCGCRWWRGATTTARSKAGHGLAHGLAADDRGEDALMVSLAQGVACKGSLPPLPDSEACAAKSLGGRSTRTTATKSALQFATAVADGCAFHGDRAQVVLQLGRLELLGLALLRNLRDVVHEVAAAAACDGPTPPPPPRKKVRGDPAMGTASGPPCPRASGTLRPMTSQTVFY